MNSELIDVIIKLTAVIQEQNEENLVLKTDLERKTATKKDYYDAVIKIEGMCSTRELLETVMDGQETVIRKIKDIVEKSGKSKLRTELKEYLKYTVSSDEDVKSRQTATRLWIPPMENKVPFCTSLIDLSKQIVLQTKEELK